jgi:dihydroneopterin aldolase
MSEESILDQLVPERLAVRSTRIALSELEVMVDIGFHEFEVGAPQRLLISVDIWLDDVTAPPGDDPAGAWDYDYLRKEVQRIAGEGRYNLQETLAHRLYRRVAALRGVKALRVATAKPDIYPDARSVGVEIASFNGDRP